MYNTSHIYSMKYWCSSPYLSQNVVDSHFLRLLFSCHRILSAVESGVVMMQKASESLSAPTRRATYFIFGIGLLYRFE